MTRFEVTPVVVALLVLAACVEAGTTTATIEANGPPTAPLGGTIQFTISAAHSSADNQGLAFLLFDLEVAGPSEIHLGNNLRTAAVGMGLNFIEPLGFGTAAGTAIGNDKIQIGGGQNTIGNDPQSEPFVPVPIGAPITGIGHGGATALFEGTLTIPANAAAGDYILRFKPGSVAANEITLDPPAGNPLVYKVRAVHEVHQDSSLRFSVVAGCTDATTPRIVHAAGLPGQTRPFSGYIDPRCEPSQTGCGPLPDRLTIVFSEPVFSPSGGDPNAGDFLVEQTGAGAPPHVVAVNTADNMTVEVILDRWVTLQEWTTVIANVVDANGCPIASLGNMGEFNEPDRVDIGFLPCDIDQSSKVEPLDLLRFRQYVAAGAGGCECATCPVPPPSIPGLACDYFDIDRNGLINPLDFLRYRQLLSGTGNATMPWASKMMNHPRP